MTLRRGSHGCRTESVLTTVVISKLSSAGHCIVCRELVALCAPLSTAAWAERKTRVAPSGLHLNPYT